MSSRIKRVVLIQPESEGGNFENVAIPRQGMLFLSAALKQWQGPYLYDTEIWFESRSGRIDPDSDLDGVDILMVTALINEAPRAYEIGRLAKQYHPELVTIGGGPLMSPLAEEAMREGKFDVVVNREGEDIIGQLSDLLLTYKGASLKKNLLKVPGISFKDDLGNQVQTPRTGVIAPDFVELPDFRAIRDLTPSNPMAGGVLETVRGCTEKCSYCQVIQQFLGYRLVKRETEFKRLRQLRQLASDGLISTSRDGRFSVFISDDLHPPPLRAVKYRNERLERLRNWKGHTDDMYMICQTRAEIGQDPELADALRAAGIRMLYVGVESDNAENLKAVRKRQDPGQMHKDLAYLNKAGFTIVAMTIIGLPYDTEESIMNMADWIRTVSKYQTANLLTPLPATPNWADLTPLDAEGNPLPADEKGNVPPEYGIRPYGLYTGRQFVHQDDRWGMEKSRQLFNKYHDKLSPIDTLYKRILQFKKPRSNVTDTGRELSGMVSARINEFSETLKTLSDSSKELPDAISTRMSEVSEALSRYRLQLSSTGKELPEAMSTRIEEATESVRRYKLQIAHTGREISDAISTRINEVNEAMMSLADLSRKPIYSDE
jgi:radical SAM superfamily enzyme YgiQ (UPF0313 family)/vacuolar-type H+-ATPase subunit H